MQQKLNLLINQKFNYKNKIITIMQSIYLNFPKFYIKIKAILIYLNKLNFLHNKMT